MKISFAVVCAMVISANWVPARAYVVFDADHPERARALAKTVKEPASRLDQNNIPVSGDTTLTIWGHGDQRRLADLTAPELIQYLKAWKKKNPKLTTIEIVTCDARHAQNDTYAAYADQVVALIAKEKDLKGLTVKALPAGLTKNSDSILYADDKGGFCYMTASAPNVFTEVNTRLYLAVKEEDGKGQTGKAVSEICNQVASGRAAEKEKARLYTLMFGQLDNLRNYLSVVKK